MLIGIAHTKRAVVHQHDCSCRGVHHNAHLNLFAQGFRCGHRIIGNRNLIAENRPEILIHISDLHTRNADDRSIFLMGMNHKINGGMMPVSRGVNAFFGRWFDIPFIGAILNINNNQFIRCKRFISSAGRCNHKLSI